MGKTTDSKQLPTNSKQLLEVIVKISEKYFADVKREFDCDININILLSYLKNESIWLYSDEVVSAVRNIRIKCFGCPLDAGRVTIEYNIGLLLFMLKNMTLPN